MPSEARTITRQELFDAFDDGLSIAHEFDGDLAAKLAAFGIDPDDLRELIEDRFRQGRASGMDGEQIFVQGLMEGLVCGITLGKKRPNGSG